MVIGPAIEVRSNLHEVLAGAFGGPDAPFTLWTDSHRLSAHFSERGVAARHFDEIEAGEAVLGNVVLIPTEVPANGESAFFAEHFDTAATLVIPLRSFGTDEAALLYLPRALSGIDFGRAAAAVRNIVDVVATAPSGLRLRSTTGTDVTVELGDDVQLMTPKGTPSIASGEWVSIAQFLEVGIVPQASVNSFTMSGTMTAHGVSIAHHIVAPDVAIPMATAAWREITSTRRAGGFPLTVEVRDNRCVSIRDRDGAELADSLLQYTDPTLRGELIELAMSTLDMQGAPDCFVNSQINEAWGGAHLAFGMGINGAHIDFVGTDIRVEPW